MAVSAEPVTAHAPLKTAQRAASDPGEHVWLSASAGTGKTYVLSARVLRLLLRGAKPDAILCLTFTKAGAAEMAERVHRRLAWWVRLDEPLLFRELEALGEASGPAARLKARTLFAEVLDSRGGGLRIMTIHAFCQTLLAGFPVEAGLVPGFRPIEGREAAVLGQNILSELVTRAEREGDARLLGDLRALSLRLGEDGARSFLTKAAQANDALGALPDGLVPLVRDATNVPRDYSADDIAAACDDAVIDREALFALCAILGQWGKTGVKRAEIIAEWLHGTVAERARGLAALDLVWNKADGDIRTGKGQVPHDPAYAGLAAQCAEWCSDLLTRMHRAALADAVAAALNAGRRYARDYADAKRTRGLVDFDDLIRMTRRLLQEPGIGDWIRYKLDQATDHILVDEAQDTNLKQWEIIAGLAAEFFAGEGARGQTMRTIFTVGDFKQAIFGFQGTDPVFYGLARGRFAAAAQAADRELVQLSLDASFRSSQPILDVTDKWLETAGHEALGLDRAAPPHRSASGGFGQVTLLQPVTDDAEGDDGGEEDWVADHVRNLAKAIAWQVRDWLAEPLWLEGKNRALTAGDIMILVRKRGELAALLVARLQEEGVAVAGIDRLRLKAPLAVKDLLAAMRFAVQRDDDLTLAALLVSPLLGWTQDELFAVAHGRPGRLWDAIPAGETRAALVAILNTADRVTPFAFLEQLLSGPLQGRKALLARLGADARDPIDELLNAALQFGRENTASLQSFIDWFDRGEGEIVRDAGDAGDAVRVMTVHGAKGLQAPLVILADAAGKPGDPGRSLDWVLEGFDDPVPLFRPRAAERALVASLHAAAEDAEARERREHWRLLYVAMTRAEERLVLAGSLSARAQGVVPADSWHAAVALALGELGCTMQNDALWGSRTDYAPHPQAHRAVSSPPAATATIADADDPQPGAPAWLYTPPLPEARPPRPLAPSSLGIDSVSNPPSGPALAAAAERGRLLHALFERLPDVAPAQRRAAGLRWLGAADDAAALVDAALRVIEDGTLADLFAPGALTEAPLAGVVDGLVVSGTVDRLLVSDTAVTVIDFKTGRRVPQTLAAIPAHHLRQMAAYVAVVAQIFPERAVTGALLYSEGPIVHRLPPGLLAAHKPGYGDAQDNLGGDG